MDGRDPGSSRVKEMDKNSASADFMRNLRRTAGLPRSPAAILVVSAHWEAEEFTVQDSETHSLLYDYTNFPDFTYRLQWPVHGAPKIAARVRDVLTKVGLKCEANSTRGLDHGVFVPLMLAYPEADVPVVQLSLKLSLDISEHLRAGEALGVLRNEGVLIVGSGQTTHNLSVNNESGVVPPWCRRFRDWFHDCLTNASYSPADRKRRLLEVAERESTFYEAHPTVEHFMPASVVCAAAGYALGKILNDEIVLSAMVMSSVLFN